jgi:hypothetical protein
MGDYSFSEGFYVNGPINNNCWSVYLCCGKQMDEDEDSVCSCKKSTMMKVILKDGDREVLVSVFISEQPSIRFSISEKIGFKLRELFQKDCRSNRKVYSTLVSSLYGDKRSNGDDLETKSMIQGLVIYISWSLLALSGNNVSQGYFSTFLSQLGNGIKTSGLDIPKITTKINNSGKKYIKTDDNIIKSLLSYRFMLYLDTVHQTLLSCDLTVSNWIRICLSWNRCIRPFFFSNKVVEDDLSTSNMYAIVMSLVSSINRNSTKTNLLENKLQEITSNIDKIRESSSEDRTFFDTPVRFSTREESPVRVNKLLRQRVASPKRKYKPEIIGCRSLSSTTYKTDKPEHLYEF